MIAQIMAKLTGNITGDQRGRIERPMHEVLDLIGWEERKQTARELSVLRALAWSGVIAMPTYFLLVASGYTSIRAGWMALLAFAVLAPMVTLYLSRSWAGAHANSAALSAMLESMKEPVCILDSRNRVVGSNSPYRRFFLGAIQAPPALVGRDKSGTPSFVSMITKVRAGHAGRGFLEIEDGDTMHFYEVSASHSGAYSIWRFSEFDPDKPVVQAGEWFDAFLRPFLEATAISVFLFSHDDDLIFYNAQALSLLGVSSAALGGVKWTHVMGQNGLLSRAAAEGRVTYETVDIPVPGLDGDPASPGGRVVIVRETHIASAAGSTINSTPQDLSRIFEGAPISIVAVGEDGEIKEFNRAFGNVFQRRLGREAEIGSSFKDFVAEEQWVGIRDRLRSSIDGKPPKAPFDLDVVGSDGQVLQTFFGTGSSAGRNSALLYMIDTTDQKLLEVQFVQAQKMQAVGQLAGGVAHDFNNLLTAIIGFCDLLLVRHKAGDQSFADIMQIKQSANRGANLVRQLLAFSRRQTLQPTVLDVTDVIAELSNLIRRLIGGKIEFELHHGRNLGRVRVDQGQLEQVIINLAVNARDAMEAGGALTIRTRNVLKSEAEGLGYSVMKPEDFVEISVEDTGSGIPIAFKDKVFEPFFTTKEVGKGTGLGLSTVYGIVKQTGGYIFVDPSYTAGTAFRIYLPVLKGVDGEKPVAEIAEVDIAPVQDLTGKGSILIVEDEDAVRLFTARALSSKGYDVSDAACGEDALDMLEAGDKRFDLMISDVVMPGMDGPTLADRAKAIHPSLKIILISGYAEEALRRKGEEVKYDFLAKPFSLNELAEKAKSVLDGE